MNPHLGLLLLAAQFLPLIVLTKLFLWFRKNREAKDFWRKAVFAAIVAGTARSAIVAIGWFLGGNPDLPKALRFVGLLCATFVLPDGLMFRWINPAKVPPATAQIIFIVGTLIGGALWTLLVAAIARTNPVSPAPSPRHSVRERGTWGPGGTRT